MKDQSQQPPVAQAAPAEVRPVAAAASQPASPARVDFQRLLGGRNALGASNANIANRIAEYNAGGVMDPALAPYVQKTNQQDQNLYTGRSDRMDPQGYVIGKDGKTYVQVGNIDPNVNHPEKFLSLDPGQFSYDDEFGILTPFSNMNTKQDPLDKAMPYIVGAALGAPVLAAATSAGAAGAGAEATAGQLPESYWGATANSGQIASDAVAGGAPVTDLSVAASSGAPVVDLSVPASGNGMLSNIGSWVRANPMNAARLAGAAGSLAMSSGSRTNSTQRPVAATSTRPTAATQQQVNPQQAAQAQQRLQQAFAQNPGLLQQVISILFGSGK